MHKSMTGRNIDFPLDDSSHIDIAVETFDPELYAKMKSENKTSRVIDIKNGKPITACNNGNSQAQNNGLVILKKNDAYYVYFAPWELHNSGYWESYLPSFISWLYTLSPDDTIYFYQSYDFHYLPFVAGALAAIEACAARTIFMLDTLFTAGCFAFVCKEIHIENTGALTLTRMIPADRNEFDASYDSFSRVMFTKVLNKGLITADEYEAIFSRDAVIFLTANSIRERVASSTTEE